MILTVSPEGTVTCVYTEALDLDAFGPCDIRRASNVEPSPDGWQAQIEDGKTLGPFPKRSQAIRAEVRYIEENVL